MKTLALAVAVSLVAVTAPATAQKKSCDELKAEIEAKLKEKGVQTYTLEIVPAAEVKDQQVVGSCCNRACPAAAFCSPSSSVIGARQAVVSPWGRS